MEELFTAAEDLKFFNIYQIIKEAVRIPAKSSPLKFSLITLTFILPLSLIQLMFEIHTSILYDAFETYFSGHDSSPSYKQFIRTYSIQEFFYIAFLFLFFLLSTSAIVFTVASLYASKAVSFIPTLFAIPRIFKNLTMTFFYALLLMMMNYLAYNIPNSVLASENTNKALLWGFFFISTIINFVLSNCIIAVWHLASVISVLEPNVHGLAAMKKSKQLLRGRAEIAWDLAYLYLMTTLIVEIMFKLAVRSHLHFMVRLLLGLLGLFMMVAVNLTGLLVQTVFFFACKSHHNQVVDRKVLYDHLCGYDLRDKSVALNPSTGSVEMQSLAKDHGRVGYQHVALDATTATVGDQNVANGEP
ncbi:hypothetical protein MKW94_000343 [Papaver nudicaule]|uniref:Uncharacterized protein n=1 Tax=Papaver nudicaule TaxID=74823 RepID=A0AA41VTR3_PAPNU|nr:hypothetical protein [Papaver nudicaule]